MSFSVARTKASDHLRDGTRWKIQIVGHS